MEVTVNEQRCVCGCAQPITNAGPSPDWATERCFLNWRRRQAGLDDLPIIDDDDPWADVFSNPDRPPAITQIRTPSGHLYRFAAKADR